MRRLLRNVVDKAFGAVGPALTATRSFRALSQAMLASAGLPRKCTQLRGVDLVWQVQSRMDEYRTDSRALEAKEPETLDWIDAHVHPGDVLFDLGANVGVYSLYAAMRTGADCRVFAFEPEFRNFSALNANILLNGLSNTVTAYCLAVADETRLSVLKSGHDESGHSGNYLERWAPANATTVRVQGVVCASLDDLVYRYDLPCPTHLKMDTDGAELAILNGASKLLADPRLRTVMRELEAETAMGREVIAAFRRNGFVCSIGKVVNVVFLRETR